MLHFWGKGKGRGGREGRERESLCTRFDSGLNGVQSSCHSDIRRRLFHSAPAHLVEEEMAVPYHVEEEMAVPCHVEEEMAVPCHVEEEMAVPYHVEEEMAVPYHAEEELSLIHI